MSERPLCPCHGEPMVSPSQWQCAVAAQASRQRWFANNAEYKRASVREYGRKRYDSDPIYRIEKNLHDSARKRAESLKRRKEELRSTLPDQGFRRSHLESHQTALDPRARHADRGLAGRSPQ